MRVSFTAILPFCLTCSIHIGFIDYNFRVADLVFVITCHFGSSRIPLILLHHRTVVFAQSGSVRQWCTHNFPSMLVKQNNLRVDTLSFEGELASRAHVDGLEPVMLILIFLSGFSVLSP